MRVCRRKSVYTSTTATVSAMTSATVVLLLTLLSPLLIPLILLVRLELQYLILPEDGRAETPQKKKLQFL